jgi:hypothetical protein
VQPETVVVLIVAARCRNTDADAGGDARCEIEARSSDHRHDALGDRRRHIAVQSGKQCAEFIAAETAKQAAMIAETLLAVAHGLREREIASAVPISIVDGFEVIHIDHQHRTGLPAYR